MLSICVPTFNREKELNYFLGTIGVYSDVQVVICDDGSTDNTRSIVRSYKNKLNIDYIYQENSGRSVALKNAILSATGKYTVLMDSDDYFMPNAIDVIFEGIKLIESDIVPSDVKSLLFGTKLIRGERSDLNIPPDLITNFIEIRADYKVKHDLKEVVLTELLKECIYTVPAGCRRVPTSLLWCRIAKLSRCLSVSKLIAVKEYLPGGMTDQNLYLKTKYSEPMVILYALLAESSAYKSVLYRLRCRLMWARYSWHWGNNKTTRFWQKLYLIPGSVIYIFDRYKLSKLE